MKSTVLYLCSIVGVILYTLYVTKAYLGLLRQVDHGHRQAFGRDLQKMGLYVLWIVMGAILPISALRYVSDVFIAKWNPWFGVPLVVTWAVPILILGILELKREKGERGRRRD